MKIKTSELSGVALDWAVAQALDYKLILEKDRFVPDFWICQVPWVGYEMLGVGGFSPSSDWSQCGPLIERFGVTIVLIESRSSGEKVYQAMQSICGLTLGGCRMMPTAPTMLIAACRIIVASKLGDEVDVPEGLV